MTLSQNFSSRLGFLGAGLALTVALGIAGAAGSVRADDGKGYFKVDPESGGTLPIKVDELHRGKIYSHFDEQLGRRVWAPFLGYGRFGVALGPTTTQPTAAFEFNLTTNDALEILRRWDPKVAADAVREGATVFLKLGDDQRWRLTRTSVATIYIAESGYRFEKQFQDYVPIGHTYGYRWRIEGQKFVPLD